MHPMPPLQDIAEDLPLDPNSSDRTPPKVKGFSGDNASTVKMLQVDDVFGGDGNAVDAVYQEKAKLLNAAFQEIGMGKYQWFLFVVGGFGWFADAAWATLASLIINPTINEFSSFKGPYLILAQNIGLSVGAIFWGVGCDVWGRRLAFNMTLFITAMFSLAAAGSPDSVTLCALTAAWNIGVGGNSPVDSAVFLEFVPATHQWLLTVLSVWWAFGQLVASLVAWPFIVNFSCPSRDDCTRSSNQGWRYSLWTCGALMMMLFVLRFFVFHLHESPKYLISQGRDAEAVEVIHAVAKYNGRTSNLTASTLKEVESLVVEETPAVGVDPSAKGAIARKMSTLNMSHVRGLFVTRKMAFSTSLLILLWALIGLAFTLYNSFVPVFLQLRGADFGDGSLNVTYRNQAILSVMGIPGSLLAGWMVEQRHLGRKGTLAIFTTLTGVFLFASTTARTSDTLLGWNSAYAFTSNVMYAALSALSPEIFPAKDRGTGNALVSVANNVSGVMAPIIALYADLSTSAPIYISAVLFVVAGLMALLLPFEPRGKASI